MAYNAWLNISVADSRAAAVYRLWDAVAHKLTGAMVGRWTVVGTSAGALPGWTSDASPANGAWVVVQCESAHGDTTKLQVFLGYRFTPGALAGYGTQAAGLWIVVSPNGGWDPINFYFGVSSVAWQNGSILSVTGYTTAAVLSLILTDRGAGKAGSLYLLARQATGNHLYSVAAVSAVPPLGSAEATTRTAVLQGAPSGAGIGWIYPGAGVGLACKTSLDGWDNAYVIQLGDYGVDRCTGMRVDGDLVTLRDIVTGTNLGMLDLVYRNTAANGDLSADGLRWAYEGYSWPREAARDGVWV